MSITLLQTLLLFVATPAPPLEPVWEYHRKELHQCLQNNDYYGAKRSLALLKHYDPIAYHDKRFDLTSAWIAQREENWDSVYHYNLKSGIKDPSSDLEVAQSLEKLGRYTDALTHLFKSNNKYTGSQRWEVYALAARCHLALADTEKAETFFRKLIHHAAPTIYRTDAYNTLVEIYYKQGQLKKARALAEKVQKRFPASDAALFTMYLQETYEEESYLTSASNLERFAMVCYRNRDFQRSNQYFSEIIKRVNKGALLAKAHYFKALTHTKQGDVEGALTAFEEVTPLLEGTEYAGMVAFQWARTLYLNERDADTVAWVSRYFQTSKDNKWRQECVRLWILSLRRQGDNAAFDDLGRLLKKERVESWLWHYYHKNGMIWAMHEERYSDAREHLNAYLNRGRLTSELRDEAELWSGLIAWSLGEKEEAVQSWLMVALRDPNHYFGLAARQLLDEGSGETSLWERTFAGKPLSDHKTDTLKMLYHLAPDETWRARIGAHLMAAFQREKPGFNLDRIMFEDTRSQEMAEIGRFDWAANVLPKNKRAYLTYHYKKSRWYQIAGDMESSIRHAEILVNSFPNWLPYELLPETIQKLHFPLGYESLVRSRAGEKNVSPYLMLAIIREESRFDHRAKSWASARGLMQFIPSTARTMAERSKGLGTFSLPKLYQPEVAITLGATYIEHLLSTFEGSSMHAVAAYNAGEGATERWRSFSKSSQTPTFVWDVTYSETKRYCQKVMRAYYHYNRLYGDASSIIEVPDIKRMSRL